MQYSFCDREECREYLGDAEIIVVEENHKKYVISNNKRKLIAKFRVDDCLIKLNEEKCDYLIVNCNERKAYFIELKGKDVKKAIEQIENTIRILKPSFKDYKINARIIASGVPNILKTDIAKFKIRMKKFHGDAKVGTNALHENL